MQRFSELLIMAPRRPSVRRLLRTNMEQDYGTHDADERIRVSAANEGNGDVTPNVSVYKL